MKVEGRNSISELLKSDKAVEKILVSKEISDEGAKRLIRTAQAKKINIKYVPKEVLSRESESGMHQGFIAFCAEYEYAQFEEISEHGGLVVVLDGIVDPHNFGSIIRVCECAGASGIIIAKDRQVPVNETVMRVSEGAANHVKIAKVTNIAQSIELLKKSGFFVYGAETGGENLYSQNFSDNCAIVIGGEDTGIRRIVREKCDVIISIPMFGQINSLNASVACAVSVYEAVRQRSK